VSSNGNIDGMRCLFVRDSDKILFGVGFEHRHFLTEDLWTDYTGRRGLRSFVGIVIDSYEFDKLPSFPTDSTFYTNLYIENIKDVWELEDRPQNRVVIESPQKEIEISTSWCQLNGSINFNIDCGKCRFFPSSKVNDILRSLKNCQSSVMVGLNVESHVTSAYRRFNVVIPNALCLETTEIHDYIFHTDTRTKKDLEEVQPHISYHKEKIHIKRKIDIREVGEQKEVYESSLSQPAILSSLKRVNPSSSINQQNSDENFLDIDWGDESDDNNGVTSISQQHLSIEPETPTIGDSESTDDKLSSLENERTSYDSGLPKKDFRPKLILVAIVSLVAFGLILMLPRKCKIDANNLEKSQNHTTLGDSIKKTTKIIPSKASSTKKNVK